MSRWVGTVVLVAALTAACDGGRDDSVRVLAAASLTEAFEAIADRFERAHPDLDVEFSFAASSQLAAQIEDGAPGDVFASADGLEMDRVVDRGDARGRPVEFARNELAIAVETGNPEGVASLADLGAPRLLVALCAPQVPCGRLAAVALDRAEVTVHPATRTANVKAAAGLVALGEADATIVYATDVGARGDIDGVVIPATDNVVTGYPIVELRDADNAAGARAFVEFLTGPRGQRTLRSFRFLAP